MLFGGGGMKIVGFPKVGTNKGTTNKSNVRLVTKVSSNFGFKTLSSCHCILQFAGNRKQLNTSS